MNTIPEAWAVELTRWRRQQIAAGMSDQSIALRHHHVTRLARWAAPRGPYELDEDDLLEWLGEQTWARETRRSVRSSLRTFYGWAVLKGRTGDNPALELPTVKPSPPSPHPTPRAAYDRALAFSGRRERAMLRLAAKDGMRRAEVAQVHRRDIVQQDDGYWLRVHGKGGRERHVPLERSLAAELLELCFAGGGYAFPGNDDGHLSARWVGKMISRLLPDGYGMHSLRHRAATDFHRESGGDLLLTQRFLGHASPATTQLYVDVDHSRMRDVVGKVSGSLQQTA